MIFLFNACAYKLGNPDRSLPGGYRQVYIPMFKNQTMEPGIEVSFTNALIQEFERSKIGRVVPSSESELIVDGNIEKVELVRSGTPLSSDLQQKTNKLPIGTLLTNNYQLIVVTRVSLRRAADGVVVWSGNFTGEKIYAPALIESAGINSVNPLIINRLKNKI